MTQHEPMASLRTALELRIKDLREERGLSQRAFAPIAGIDRNYLAHIENGKRNVSIDLIEKIANGFGITVGELFDGL